MLRIQRFMKSRAGFTLVELLVVIVVIGILAGIAIPRITGMRGRAQVARVESDLRSVHSGLELFYIDNDHYPDMTDTDDEDAIEEFLGEELVNNYFNLDKGAEFQGGVLTEPYNRIDANSYEIVWTHDNATLTLTQDGLSSSE